MIQQLKNFTTECCLWKKRFGNLPHMYAFQKYLPYYKSSLKLAVPVMISQLGHTLVSFSDSIIVGQFAGTASLAAVSLGIGIFMLFMIIGIGISYGLTPLVSQANGSMNFYQCGRLLAHSFIVNCVTGVVLFFMIYLGSEFILDHLKQDPEVVELAKPFLNLLGFSIIPLMVFLTFKQFAEGLGFTKQAMMISIWGNVINIILGIILVKGMFGIAPMGVRGVGYSTLVDRVLMALAMGFYVLRAPIFRKYIRSFTFHKLNKAYFKKIIGIGAPVALQSVFEIAAFSFAGIMAGWISVDAQAAHQIALNLASMTYMIASGIGAAAGVLTGNYLGKKDFLALRNSGYSNFHIGLFFMALTALFFIILHPFLPYIYTDDLNVIPIAANLFIIAGIFQLFDGAQVIGLGVLRGIGDVKMPTIIAFLSYWIVGIPLSYILSKYTNWGVYGIWIALSLSLVIGSSLLFFRFKIMSKKLIQQALS